MFEGILIGMAVFFVSIILGVLTGFLVWKIFNPFVLDLFEANNVLINENLPTPANNGGSSVG